MSITILPLLYITYRYKSRKKHTYPVRFSCEVCLGKHSDSNVVLESRLEQHTVIIHAVFVLSIFFGKPNRACLDPS